MINKNKIKVLSLGLSQSNFLVQLYKGIQKIDANLLFDVDGFYEISKTEYSKDKDSLPFKNMLELSRTKISLFHLLKYLLISFLDKNFWKVVFFEFSDSNFSIIKAIKSGYSYVRQYIIVVKEILPKKYNIYNFHYCTPEYLNYIHFLPNKSKIICSFWGSDLLRTSGAKNSFYVGRALQKASLITTQSHELKEIILSKYGRNLEDKIQILKFTISQDIYDNINEIKVKPNIFRSIYNIPEKAKIITIGYNAKKENNHLVILEELNKLPENYKKDLVIILPISYGIKDEYIQRLNKKIKILIGLKCIMIHGFLKEKEVAQLRVNTDIQIQMPVSDALSGSVTEVMYAGNFVIAASWLPYSPFKKAKLFYFEAETFSEINLIIIKILSNFETLKYKTKTNKNNIEKYFFPQTTSKSWIKLYKKLK